MSCKEVTCQVFTLLYLLVGLSTSITKTNDYLETSTSITKLSFAVDSNSPVISLPLFSFLCFGIMLWTKSIYQQSIGWRWRTIESAITNSSELCGMRYVSVKTNGTASIKILYIIDFIREMYIYIWSPFVSCKSIIEAIKSKSFKYFLMPINLS